MRSQTVVVLFTLCLSAFYAAGYRINQSNDKRLDGTLRQLLRQQQLRSNKRGGNRFIFSERSEPGDEVPLETFRQQALDKHNEYRSKHCVPALQLDDELNNIAQQYAEKLAATDTFEHSGATFHGEWMGENIYTAWSSESVLNTPGDKAVTKWYNEISDYDWNNPTSSSGTGHFTQVVWKASTRLGIGRAVSASNKIYVVANYFPGGNFNNAYEENVPRLC
ncbi:unnamed protein product [Adineta ricciae]|uniref:SCP domain-containing protein n=1 Tax=Adineta ricciae TaxID=249248 RepID=A0A815JS68_ADIRI|nr:unnamed protein product [Adineta ricciae]